MVTDTTIAIARIRAIHHAIERSLFTIAPPLAPSRIPHALRLLVKILESTETDESVWSIGEFGNCTLDSLIVGAYWYFTDYHAGQCSEEYATLCALGRILSPGMSSLDEDSPEHEVYQALEEYLD